MRRRRLRGIPVAFLLSIALGALPVHPAATAADERPDRERIERFYESLGATPVPCGEGLKALGPVGEALCASVDLPFKRIRKQAARDFDRRFGFPVPFLDTWDRQGERLVRVILLKDDLWTLVHDRNRGRLASLPFRPCSREGIPPRTSRFVAPERIATVDPDMPDEALRQRSGGIAVLELRIDADGVPDRTCVIGVFPEGMGFEDEALEAVRGWRYRPAEDGQGPVAAYLLVWLRWTIR